MEFTDRGSGPALLLIHGFPLDRRIWTAQVEALAGAARVVAPDLPGFGRTPVGTPPPAAMEDYARALLGLMDRLGAPTFSAAGHSMGGYVLFALHRLAPGRLAGAALVSTRAIADGAETRKAREETALRAEREGAGFLVESFPAKVFGPAPDPDQLEAARAIIRDASPAGVAAACRAMGARPDASPQLASLPRTVVVAGRLDRFVPPAESEAMAAAIPGAKLFWAERSGHMPMVEEPGRVTEALRFLL